MTLPSGLIFRAIGVFLLAVVALRHTKVGKMTVPEWLLVPGGVLVGFLSAIVGSAGTLGAILFLGLPAGAYVASEAVTATAMHLTKTIVYGRYSLLTPTTWGLGLALSAAMILGSWTGRKFVERLPRGKFALLVEVLLVAAALSLILSEH